MNNRAGSFALIVIGALFLLNNLGVFRFARIGALFHTWWPALLILAGVLGLFGKRGR
ncbi:MAG TPA: DUF5668 domain-containing protein [Rhodocyclaceae bacterium]|nr:DUF5668 domain-containing protein [Rhodocyclaceae bacterium]